MISLESKPLVSIVLATYNGEKYLRPQLDSLFQQTYEAIEVVAVDDLSTDGTFAILNEYANKFSNLRAIQNSTNLGYVKNFEKGFQMAKGQYIAPCDQDDIWMLDKIETLVNQIGNAPIVYSDSLLIDHDGNILNRKLSDIKHLQNFTTCLNYAIGGSAPGHAMLIQRKVLDACYPFPNHIPHDYWIGFVALFFGPIIFLPNAFILYRQHASNVFGVSKAPGRLKKTRDKKAEAIEKARKRMQALFEKCPNGLPEKIVLSKLFKSYQSFSLRNNWSRMLLFLSYNQEILAFKKRNTLRRYLFSFKMFFKIV